MKKIAKISLLVILGLGLAGCGSDYYRGYEQGSINSYARIISKIESGEECKITFEDEEETNDFIETINNGKFENIDYVKKQDDLTAIVKFKDLVSKEKSGKHNTQEQIIEKDGKKYKVIIEEISENQSKIIAEEAVGKATKSSSSK